MFFRRFGSWPVAIHVGTKYRAVLEGPICKGNRVMGWHTVQTVQKKSSTRRFPIGFSAFAFNSTMLWDPQRWNRSPMDSVMVHSGGRGGLQVSLFGYLNCNGREAAVIFHIVDGTLV
jgi:putative beta-1,4-xylosyltransferase IRX9